jgi:hypothetical protein
MLVTEHGQQRHCVAGRLEHAAQLPDDRLLPHAEPLELRRLRQQQDLVRVGAPARALERPVAVPGGVPFGVLVPPLLA